MRVFQFSVCVLDHLRFQWNMSTSGPRNLISVKFFRSEYEYLWTPKLIRSYSRQWRIWFCQKWSNFTYNNRIIFKILQNWIWNFCQILEGSFSAVSKPIFASKYAFCRICQALQDLHAFPRNLLSALMWPFLRIVALLLDSLVNLQTQR